MLWNGYFRLKKGQILSVVLSTIISPCLSRGFCFLRLRKWRVWLLSLLLKSVWPLNGLMAQSVSVAKTIFMRAFIHSLVNGGEKRKKMSRSLLARVQLSFDFCGGTWNHEWPQNRMSPYVCKCIFILVRVYISSIFFSCLFGLDKENVLDT